MKKSFIQALLALSIGATVAINFASADPIKGQKVLERVIHKECKTPATSIALTHSIKEWDAIIASGNLEAEITKLCKSEKPIDPIRAKYLEDVKQFLVHYSNDSGAIPA